MWLNILLNCIETLENMIIHNWIAKKEATIVLFIVLEII